MKVWQASEEISRALSALPDSPGVYIFKDQLEEIIYIGKALSLRSRVRSYWNVAAWRERPKLAVMMPKVTTIETILTNSEKEALILEATMVRQNKPRYNVALKDDKRYPWLAITYDEPFPRLIMVRDPAQFRRQNPKSRVFGPYVEAGLMWQTVRILRKVFPMRQRRKPLFKDRPCMNFHLGLCLGPCQNLVAEPIYNRIVKQVEMFLAGRQKEVVSQLKQEMEAASQDLEFEQAANIRDRLSALNTVIERQQVFSQNSDVNQDILAEAHGERTICVCLLRIREGKLVSSEAISVHLIEKTEPLEAFGSVVDQYYTACEDIALPAEVVLQHELEDMGALADLLTQKAVRQVKVNVPRKGRKLDLVQMAEKNARASLDQQLANQAEDDQKVADTLLSLKSELRLKTLPRRIECFDISNIQGTDNVASMVVFENAKARKSDYRHFKIKSVEGEANDFASMKEVVGRRYLRIFNEGKPMPDLIIIDGGKGQLNAALEALAEIGVQGQDIVGLAKRQEEVYFPGKPEPELLPRRSPALFLLQATRDEAHRFAVNFHRKLRARRSISSNLDALPGIGKARRKILLDHFGSFDNLLAAELEAIQAVTGIPKTLASTIYSHLHKDSELNV